jgi:hypothetical protein
MAKRAIKIIIAAEGEDFQIQFRRNEGFLLYVRGEYCGTFDRLTEAQAERDALVYERLNRAPLAVGDAVRIGASARTGVVEAIGYTDVFVRLDDNGRLAAFQPQYVKKTA